MLKEGFSFAVWQVSRHGLRSQVHTGSGRLGYRVLRVRYTLVVVLACEIRTGRSPVVAYDKGEEFSVCRASV